MIQAPKPIDEQTLNQMRETWSATRDVIGVLRVLESQSVSTHRTARELADGLIAAFDLSPATIGIVREWKDGRMPTDDFVLAISDLIEEAASGSPSR